MNKLRNVGLLLFFTFSTATVWSQTTQTATLPMDTVKAEPVFKPNQTILKSEHIGRSAGAMNNPLNSLLYTPGVIRSGDFINPSPIYIQGSAPGENLFLSDNTIMVNPWYFGGQQSVYNSEMIDHIELLKSGFSAKYGNSLGSVVQVHTREPDYQEWKGYTNLGIFYSQTALNIPIVSDKMALIIAVRTSVFDKILRAITTKQPTIPIASLLDGNIKWSYRINQENTIVLSSFSSLDKNILNPRIDTILINPFTKVDNKGNQHIQSLLWERKWAEKWSSKLLQTHSQSDDHTLVNTTDSLRTQTESWGIREDIGYDFSPNRSVQFGFEAYKNTLSLSGFRQLSMDYTDPQQPDQLPKFTFSVKPVERYRWGTYAFYEGKLYRGLSGNIGMRYDVSQGPGVWSPRVRLQYALGSKTTLQGAYGYYYQFVSDETAATQATKLPADKAIHYTLSVSHQFGKGWSASIETYYKNYAQLNVIQADWMYFDQGKGNVKGIEFLVQKNQGRLQAWLSYALAHSQRTYGFDRQLYDFAFDERHVLNAILEFKTNVQENSIFKIFSDFIQLRYRFETGRPYTPIQSAVQINQLWYPVRGQINSERLPNYSNLTLRMEWRNLKGRNKNGRITGTYYLELLNVFNQKNISMYKYSFDKSNGENIKKTAQLITEPGALLGAILTF